MVPYIPVGYVKQLLHRISRPQFVIKQAPLYAAGVHVGGD